MFLHFQESWYRMRIRESKLASKNIGIKQTRDTLFYASCYVSTTYRPNVTQGRLHVTWRQNASSMVTGWMGLLEVFCFQVTQNVTSRVTTVTKNSTVEYHVKFNRAKKKTDSTDCKCLIFLFIHLKKQTDSGKYKNITQ